MKKYTTIFLSFVFCITMFGCSDENKNDINYDKPKLELEHVDLNNYVVYINLDGFANYYYEEAIKRGVVPTLESLKSEGLYFSNLVNLTPSITNPMQNMIISGASSNATHNVYRYYDKTIDTVIQQARENSAYTIYEVAAASGISTISIRHYLAEEALSTNKKDNLYVKEAFGTEGNAINRFDQAIKVVKGETFMNYNSQMKVSEIPHFLTIYCDDLDALGHNMGSYYGYHQAQTEEERMNNILDCLNKIDGKLKELINAYKERGIYDKTTFLLTTDHGMTPYGAQTIQDSKNSKYAYTKWPELKKKLTEINSKYVFEYVPGNKSPKRNTTVVGVSCGLQMQLTFKNEILSENDLQTIAKTLENEYYIEKVLTRKMLIDEGYWDYANVDLLVIPSERYHFHDQALKNNCYAVLGQHDSYLNSSHNVYGIIWGNKVNRIGTYEEKVIVTSFGVAMADLLKVNLPNANSNHLPIFNDDK